MALLLGVVLVGCEAGWAACGGFWLVGFGVFCSGSFGWDLVMDWLVCVGLVWLKLAWTGRHDRWRI